MSILQSNYSDRVILRKKRGYQCDNPLNNPKKPFPARPEIVMIYFPINNKTYSKLIPTKKIKKKDSLQLFEEEPIPKTVNNLTFFYMNCRFRNIPEPTNSYFYLT